MYSSFCHGMQKAERRGGRGNAAMLKDQEGKAVLNWALELPWDKHKPGNLKL